MCSNCKLMYDLMYNLICCIWVSKWFLWINARVSSSFYQYWINKWRYYTYDPGVFIFQDQWISLNWDIFKYCGINGFPWLGMYSLSSVFYQLGTRRYHSLVAHVVAVLYIPYSSGYISREKIFTAIYLHAKICLWLSPTKI